MAVVVFITLIPAIKKYIKGINKNIYLLGGVSIAFAAFLVIGRILSGVHWFSDIIGALLISSTLVIAYYFFDNLLKEKLPQ